MFVSRSRITGGLLAVGVASALLVPLASPAQAAEVELEARMVHTARFPSAHGRAEYDAENGHREFEIHLAGLPHRLHGRLVTVRVHGALVGRMRVQSTGRAHLDRTTGVVIDAGNVVRVRAPSGRVVSYGTLRLDHD